MSIFRKYLKSQRGFTLIEIVVVVALIGILLSILMPSFEKAGDRTKNNKLIADLRTLDTAIGLYKLDTGKLPENLTVLRPDYISGKDAFKDAKGGDIEYVPSKDAETYTLKGKNTKNEDVLSASSTKASS